MQVQLKDRRGGAGKPTYPLSDFQGSCFFSSVCAYKVLQAAEHSAPLQCLSLQITVHIPLEAEMQFSDFK